MAVEITQICDGCVRKRHIRNLNETSSFQWVSFYDNRYHLCPDCIKEALSERSKKDGFG